MKSALPDADDVRRMLLGLPKPITLSDEFMYQVEIDAAVEEWDRRTYYSPFFQTSASNVTRYFDPPGPNRTGYSRGASTTLLLGNGLLSLNTLSVGVVTADSDPGTVLTSGKDFWLAPTDAQANPSKIRPYTWVEFALPQRGLPQSIAISGVWGYCNAANGIPMDAWIAIRDIAAARCLEKVAEGILARAAAAGSWKDGESSQSYDPAIITRLGMGIRASAERTLMRYRLLAY